jgi:hypothetical protein
MNVVNCAVVQWCQGVFFFSLLPWSQRRNHYRFQTALWLMEDHMIGSRQQQNTNRVFIACKIHENICVYIYTGALHHSVPQPARRQVRPPQPHIRLRGPGLEKLPARHVGRQGRPNSDSVSGAVISISCKYDVRVGLVADWVSGAVISISCTYDVRVGLVALWVSVVMVTTSLILLKSR